jgi:hypothetical protein
VVAEKNGFKGTKPSGGPLPQKEEKMKRVLLLGVWVFCCLLLGVVVLVTTATPASAQGPKPMAVPLGRSVLVPGFSGTTVPIYRTYNRVSVWGGYYSWIPVPRPRTTSWLTICTAGRICVSYRVWTLDLNVWVTPPYYSGPAPIIPIIGLPPRR